MPAQLARTGAHVDHVVCREDGVLVVLDHNHGVTHVAQALERCNEAVVVTLVKADGRLVQDVEHAHEPGADLRGKADALRLSARERSGGAAQGEVVETHVHHEAQTRLDLLNDGPGNCLLALGNLELLEERQAVAA